MSHTTAPSSRAVHGGSGKLLTIEAARGIAALLVAFYHGAQVVAQSLPGQGMPFGGFFGFGHAGVPFFFVLSGYIIFHVHRGDLGRPNRLGLFAWKRITRIYPLFLIVMVPVTVKCWLTGQFAWEYFLKSALLLPQRDWPMLIPSWTLVHEMLFYVLFALAIWNVRAGRCALLAWTVLFGAARVLDPQWMPGLAGDTLRTLAAPCNLLFILGMGVAWVLEHRTVPRPRLLALGGGLAFLAAGLVDNAGVSQDMAARGLLSMIVYGVGTACIILGLVAAESAGTLRAGRFAALLGALSYPLYLTHGIAISIVVDAARKFGYAGSGTPLLAGAVALACAAALLVHRCIERPVAGGLKRLWNRRAAAPAFT